MNILACDLGGTKVLLGIYSENSKTKAPNLILKKKYSSSEWDSFYSILDDFILTECKNKIPSTACLAIAGAIKNNSAKITNLNWEISHKYLKRKYNFQNLELINDFSVLIYGIPFISNNQYAIIQQGNKLLESNNKLHAVIGAGTGLGVARGIIDADKISVLSSEGGHSEFSPRSTEEWELKEWLQKYLNLERVSSERVISGDGLYLIAKWRFSKSDLRNHPFQKILNDSDASILLRKDIPAMICKMSKGGDKLMIDIEKLWFYAYAWFSIASSKIR